jgi:DNA-binding protein HU-beta
MMAKAKAPVKKAPAKKAAAKKPAAKPTAKAAPAAKKAAMPDKFTMTTMIAYVADKSGLSKKQAKDSIESFIEVVTAGMLAGNRVPFGTVGKAYVRERPATKKRMGRNPKTGENVVIPAKPAVRVPKFTYGKAFKDAAKKSKAKKA